MFNVVLFEPEIAPNTGNIIRLCSNVGAQLHLIEPLGFNPDEKKLRRAGLDYGDWESVVIHKNYQRFLDAEKPKRLFSLSTKSAQRYSDQEFGRGDYFLFGPETRGLPEDIMASIDQGHQLTIPMAPNNRSLNLSNSVAIVLYEAWRRNDFVGAVTK